MNKMEIQTALCGIFVLMFAGIMCAPTKKGFLEFSCDENFNCTDDLKSVCGSDGNTYDNECKLALENQYRYCKIGDFNRIAITHTGNCTSDGT